MRVLLVGDIMGRLGRRAVTALVPALREELELDFVIANAENAAAGRGTTAKIANQLFESGVDLLTGGNHTWAMHEFVETLDSDAPVLRAVGRPVAVHPDPRLAREARRQGWEIANWD